MPAALFSLMRCHCCHCMPPLPPLLIAPLMPPLRHIDIADVDERHMPCRRVIAAEADIFTVYCWPDARLPPWYFASAFTIIAAIRYAYAAALLAASDGWWYFRFRQLPPLRQLQPGCHWAEMLVFSRHYLFRATPGWYIRLYWIPPRYFRHWCRGRQITPASILRWSAEISRFD